MFLCDITYCNNNTGGNKLTEQGIHQQQLNKEFKQQVVDNKIGGKGNKVAKQLNTAFEIGINKDNIFHQNKSYNKIYAERNKQRRDMRLKSKETKIEIFLLKNILIANKVDKQTQYRIASTACCITKCLCRH